MSLEKLTADHRETLGRLEAQERQSKRSGRWLATALVTALGTGGATLGKHWLDYRQERRRVELRAGSEAKSAELGAVQWDEAAGALEAMDQELTERAGRLSELETRIARAEVAIDFLTADQRWIRRTADRRVGDMPHLEPVRKSIRLPAFGELEADPERVQQRKAKILETLD